MVADRDDRRSLRPLFEPRSVAVVGASDDPAKWGHHVALAALRGEGRRPVYLVNGRSPRVLGRDAHPDLASLPELPDLVAVAVPAASFEAVVDQALAAGARAIVGITAGLGEKGGADEDRQREIAARVRQAGAVLVGPNCAGLSDSTTELHLEWESYDAGPVALVSQSGNLISEIAALGAAAGLGFSRCVSIGNQADLTAADFLEDLADHEPTRVVACYVEDFKAGRRFIEAARRCLDAGKAVIVLTAGRSEVGGRTAFSHTGALVSDAAVVRAACREAGAHLVATPGELVDIAQLWRHLPHPSGRRVAVFGDGGGACAIAADSLVTAGLEMPSFGIDLRRRLGLELPGTRSDNPVDLAGAGEHDIEIYARVFDHLADSPQVDAVLLTGYFGGYSSFGEEFQAEEVRVARELAARSRRSGKPFVVHSMFGSSSVAAALREGGVPVYQRIEMATRALGSLAEQIGSGDRRAQDREEQVRTERAGTTGAGTTGAGTTGAGTTGAGTTGAGTTGAGTTGAGTTGAGTVEAGTASNYFTARSLVAEAGIALTRAVEITSLEEAMAAAAAIGWPVALKAVAFLHKSDAGGIALGLEDGDELAAALDAMAASSPFQSFSVEEMAAVPEGLELIVGVKRDRSFGPVVMLGVGGIHAESLSEFEVALVPATARALRALLLDLPIADLLTGGRGRPPLDIEAAATAAVRLADFAAARPEIAEIEVNPLLVLRSGVIALDARVVMVDHRTDFGPRS